MRPDRHEGTSVMPRCMRWGPMGLSPLPRLPSVPGLMAGLPQRSAARGTLPVLGGEDSRATSVADARSTRMALASRREAGG
jgi:hypothetical protein